MKSKKENIIFLVIVLSVLTFAFLWYYLVFYTIFFIPTRIYTTKAVPPAVALEEVIKTNHISTPDAVRGIYMTSCVAGSPKWRESLAKLVENTELNSIVIDVKDYSGTISFKSEHPLLEDNSGTRCVVKDMEEFVKYLHDKEIYAIARITVFQDPIYAKKHLDLAVQKNNGSLWRDYKGISYIDPWAREFWDYIVALSRESYNIGFDELNYDYIRFPSDGNMRDIYYPFSEDVVNNDPVLGKAKIIRSFFSYLDEKMSDTEAVLSADLFGMATTNTDDLNIGQILEYAEPYFDYIAPMVYPSHYPTGFLGFADVNAHPYAIVKHSMDKASTRLINASSTPEKLRPWLQDFSWPVTYTTAMVRTQIQATYDAGLDSWMLWNASNRYSIGAFN